jgi:hypothetical protein
MCHFWSEILGMMTGSGFVLVLNLFDAKSTLEAKQYGAKQLNSLLGKELRKFPKIIRERRFSENHLFTQMAALIVIFIILSSVIRRTVKYLIS